MGQNRLLRARKPIESVLANPETPREIREQLLLVLQVREFAIELGLDVGKQYTSFAEWPGDRVVTSVVATRPGSVTPAGFCSASCPTRDSSIASAPAGRPSRCAPMG